MIIVRLMGGLGNQFFQYAFARSFSLSKNIECMFDLSSFSKDPIRNYMLNKFNTLAKDCNSEIISQIPLKHSVQRRLPRVLLNILTAKSSIKMVYEKTLSYDPSIFKYNDNVYFSGYWQSEKYFDKIRSFLLQELTLKDKTSLNLNKQLDFILTKENTVSVHFRRGDYIHNLKANKHHGVCSEKYYEQAMHYIKRKVGNPFFIIFSDEPEWVRNNCYFHYPHFIMKGNIDTPWIDLTLMKSCKHHIIANSSFSWWAAWLSENPNKLVVAPKKWLRNTLTEDIDILPDSWIQI